MTERDIDNILALMVLLVLSIAFYANDHHLLLPRLQNQTGICGKALDWLKKTNKLAAKCLSWDLSIWQGHLLLLLYIYLPVVNSLRRIPSNTIDMQITLSCTPASQQQIHMAFQKKHFIIIHIVEVCEWMLTNSKAVTQKLNVSLLAIQSITHRPHDYVLHMLGVGVHVGFLNVHFK